MDGIASRLAGARQLLTPILGEEGRRLPLGHAAADAALRGGLKRGALHEIFGDASAIGFAAGLARRAAGQRRLLWIVQDFSALEQGALAPTGLAEFGIDPTSLLMLCAANATDALRAAADALSCSALGAVIVEIPGHPKILDLVASRRLVLGAQSKGVTALLLRPMAEAEPSAAETRWHIRSRASEDTEDWGPSADADNWGSPRFDAELTRNRHGETGRWDMEWCCDDGAFRQAAHPGAVVSAPADRPAAAQIRRAG
jgi:protein ImuA